MNWFSIQETLFALVVFCNVIIRYDEKKGFALVPHLKLKLVIEIMIFIVNLESNQ